MLKEFLQEVVVSVAGKPAEPVAELLDNKNYVNEFIIAKKTDMTINQIRNILYKISDYGLVSSIRKKDKKKGWYTYFWKIEIVKALEFLKSILLKRISQFDNQINSRESKQFYICERCNIEFSEENALLHDFTCNECGDVFTIKDNSKLLKELHKNRDRLNEKLAVVEEELAKEVEKVEKAKEKELKKIQKEKEEKRKASRKKAAKKRAANKKVAKKKTVKKKVSKKKTTKKKTVKKKVSKKKTTKKKVTKKK